MATQQTPFEALGDRRFQAFAQSLISYEFPDLQALPVGQRDGGRDALTRGKRGDDFVVFQVKFVERPDYLADVEMWIRKLVNAERKNIDRLIDRGARRYYLITNVPGSAHLDVGSIDRAAAVMRDEISIPTQILWRNDLEIRLSKHRSLKWQYRELLSGQDVFDELVTSGLTEHQDRRRDAISASLAAQYEADRTVRFKQVDLQNDLIDLFVDVPLQMGKGSRSGRVRGWPEHQLIWSDLPKPVLVPKRYYPTEPRGAAELLLTQPLVPTATRIVVEGAPGQGKSTLAQYLCQFHRIRLLSKKADLDRFPESHREVATRLPFKIDLREIATFFHGEDPFAEVTGWGGIPENWPRSLVGFLAAQVSRYSGGATFTVSDLLAIARTGPMLLVLDGLDEVAELSDRRLIVDTIETGLAALEEVAESVQVVVTTRPAAFANAPGFSSKNYQYTALASLTTDLIISYTKRWAGARRLASEELTEALAILDAKLDEPHMRDLARNPMQLAILLSLINTKGESLPDKRTQLYSGYMDLYFDREASKSQLVRNRRDLLYGLHGHLAWMLHVGAARSARDGSIALEDLKKAVAKYLDSQGEDAGLTDELFQGVVERIIALVATRQERFEFEVQPLREFFAAHYLFATAQVSQLGTARPGTRADRFDALARDAFWLNVARFFAGFYTSGELPSLADRLEHLATDPAFTLTDHVRGLCAKLLADWSFSLDRRSRERVVAVVVRGLGKRHAMESRDEQLILPRGSGREEVRDESIRLIEKSGLSTERRRELMSVLGMHIEPSDFVSQWIELTQKSSGQKRTDWLQFGAGRGLVGRLSTADLEVLIVGDGESGEWGVRGSIAINDGAADVVEGSEQLSKALIRSILDRPDGVWFDDPGQSVLAAFGQIVVAGTTGLGGRGFRESPAIGEWPTGESTEAVSVPDYLAPCADVVRLGVKLRAGSISETRAAWSEIVEVLRAEDSGAWACIAISVAMTAAVRRGRSHGRSGLTDENAPLMKRVFDARSRSGDTSGEWWRHQFLDSLTAFHGRLASVCAVLWATGVALKANSEFISATVERLGDEDFASFVNVVRVAASLVPTRKSGLSRASIRS